MRGASSGSHAGYCLRGASCQIYVRDRQREQCPVIHLIRFKDIPKTGNPPCSRLMGSEIWKLTCTWVRICDDGSLDQRKTQRSCKQCHFRPGGDDQAGLWSIRRAPMFSSKLQSSYPAYFHHSPTPVAINEFRLPIAPPFFYDLL